MPARQGCPLCPDNGKVKIVDETTSCYLVAALNPPIPGSFLLVPKKHITDVRSLPATWQVAMEDLLPSIPWWTPDASFNMSLNNGKAAGQTLEHLHMWVIPRSTDESNPSYSKGLGALIKELDQSTATAAP